MSGIGRVLSGFKVEGPDANDLPERRPEETLGFPSGPTGARDVLPISVFFWRTADERRRARLCRRGVATSCIISGGRRRCPPRPSTTTLHAPQSSTNVQTGRLQLLLVLIRKRRREGRVVCVDCDIIKGFTREAL